MLKNQQTSHAPINPKIAFIVDVENITGFHRSTLRRKWESGTFPRPTLLDGTRLAWQMEAIEQWIKDKFQGDINEQLNQNQS